MNHTINSLRPAARLALSLLASISLHHGTAHAQSPLQPCAEQFIDNQLTNAPAVNGSPSGQPFATNRHLCYRDDNTSFFAIEYWPEQFTPRWAAYKLSPQNYGERGCSTYTRDVGNCYISETTWDQFLACTDSDDPFHTDHMLPDPKLAKNDFANTGHDRGHIAPRQAFSWHVCATYQTFTMANMSAQTAFLNQEIWQYLEEQILTWAVDHGPIYVVSGTMFTTFPHQRFQIYSDAILNPQQIYISGSTMMQIAQRHHANFLATHPGDILRPKRDANPASVPQRVRNLRMPTGYFAVIYRPPLTDDPARAIGFLLPHSFENLNFLAASFPAMDPKKAFWAFAARIDLIEQASGIHFPGIPSQLKSTWRSEWFFQRAGGRNIRASTCGRGTPQGVLLNSTKQQRLQACIDRLQ
jgi:hypothetical protein